MIFITKKESGYEKYRMKIERYYAVNYPFYTMDFHAHSEWEIMYVAYGRAKISCMEEAGEKIYELREGEYILIEGNIPHKLTVEKETPCRMLNLEGRELRDKEVSFFQSLTKEEGMRSFLEQESSVIAGRDDGRLHETLSELIRELKERKRKKEASLLADLLMVQMLIHLKRQWAERKINEGNISFYIRRAQEYLEENFDSDITVAQVAEAVNLSEGYLQRLYKKEKGISLMEKVLWMRIEKAKLLLENSTLPVIDVAVAAGFNSRQHFSSTFTRLVGCSPAAWRKSKGNIQVSEGFEK